MRLGNVAFGIKTGKTVLLEQSVSGFDSGKEYVIEDHKMDLESWSYKHYYLIKNDAGDYRWVASDCFGTN